MNKEIVKKGYDLAQKEIEEKQVEAVKEIVRKTLEKLKSIEEQITKLEEDRKILKMDIDDLKQGRLDRIEERQKLDKKAKDTSVVEIVKEIHHHHYDYWNQPYTVKLHYQEPWYPANKFFCASNNVDVFGTCTATNAVDSTFIAGSSSMTLNNTVFKNNVVGTYVIGNDKVINLR